MRHGVSLAMEPKLLIGALGSPYKSASASKGLPPPEAQNSYEYKKDWKNDQNQLLWSVFSWFYI